MQGGNAVSLLANVTGFLGKENAVAADKICLDIRFITK